MEATGARAKRDSQDAAPAKTRTDGGLRMVGLNHRSAPIEIRESLTIGRDELAAALAGLLRAGAREAALLATCNRLELYADAPPALLRSFFLDGRGSQAALEPCLYEREGKEACAHLFRVAASLDSLVLGEDQILAQVKTAYDAACQGGTAGPLLHASFQAAIKVGKRVRRETRIGERMLSVSSVAVEFIQKVFSDLSKRSVLLVGAGDAARLTLVHLRARGAGVVRIANRSRENAERLARELGGEAVSMDALEAEVARADIVVTSVGSPRPLVTESMVAKALRARHGSSIFLLDIAVPRDVEPSVERLTGAFLYNMDDIQRIVRENYGKRVEDLDLAAAIVEEEVERHLGRERHRKLGPLVQEMLARIDHAAEKEVEASLARMNGIPKEAREEVSRLAERLVRRILHAPLTAIRKEARAGDDDAPLRLMERVLENLPPRPSTDGRASAGTDGANEAPKEEETA